ncbi:hypothetical protein PVAP13_9KG156970 [Panicum virgatum]|uniref:Uncharacterized protein n=1 Tax=Panicum virgatum TaxID=38727 RepID=A0A8T0NHD0_PANVG|nr:hypothetical protein PVAP13_9KG156970 [Panicum virgatum]
MVRGWQIRGRRTEPRRLRRSSRRAGTPRSLVVSAPTHGNSTARRSGNPAFHSGLGAGTGRSSGRRAVRAHDEHHRSIARQMMEWENISDTVYSSSAAGR